MIEYVDPATQAMKDKQGWHSERLEMDIEVVWRAAFALSDRRG